MNNYRDTFIKPEYLHYFKKFSDFQDIVVPAKKNIRKHIKRAYLILILNYH